MAAEATQTMPSDVVWGGKQSPFNLSYGKLMIWFFLASDALTFTGLLSAVGFARHSLGPGEVWPIGEEVFRAFPGLSGSFPLMYVALMTFILIVSSVTMVLAVEAGHRMDKKGVIKWLSFTILGGFFFLGSQAIEWTHFIHGSHARVSLADGQIAYLVKNPHKGETIDPATFGMRLGNWVHGELIEGPAAYEMYRNAVHVTTGASMTENEYGPTQYANLFFSTTGFHGLHVTIGLIILISTLVMVLRGVMHRRGHYEMVEKAGLYWHFVDLVWVFVFTFFYLI